MTSRISAFFAAALIASASLLTMSCSKGNDEAIRATEPATSHDDYVASMGRLKALIKGGTSLKNREDSLSYYLGFCEGMSWGKQLKGVGVDSATVEKDDYLLGVYSSLNADTTSTSFADGVLAASRVARYLDNLESEGVKINRGLLVATIVEALNNLPADEETLAEADDISNQLIMRHR